MTLKLNYFQPPDKLQRHPATKTTARIGDDNCPGKYVYISPKSEFTVMHIRGATGQIKIWRKYTKLLFLYLVESGQVDPLYTS